MQTSNFSSYEDACVFAADIFASQLQKKPASVLGLATGSTPLGVYDKLASYFTAGKTDFSSAFTINLDEYCGLKSDHPQSYHFYMKKNLFSRVNLKPENTFLPDGNATDLLKECKRYDKLIDTLGGIDLQLLGIGLNGHIAFNEPDSVFRENTHVVKLSDSTVKANSRFFTSENQVPSHAITMGIGQIMNSRHIVIMACGKAKVSILMKALSSPVTPLLPASVLQLHPDLTVICTAD